MSAACEVQAKIKVIGGPGKLEKKISEARGWLVRINSERWRSPLAPGRIWRFYYGKQKPQPEEVDDVRAAYDRFLKEKRALAEQIFRNIEYCERTDPDMYREQIESLIAMVDQLRPFLHGRV